MGKDYYKLLGVDKNAGEAELKKGGCTSQYVFSRTCPDCLHDQASHAHSHNACLAVLSWDLPHRDASGTCSQLHPIGGWHTNVDSNPNSLQPGGGPSG
jgi:hypothetical protein